MLSYDQFVATLPANGKKGPAAGTTATLAHAHTVYTYLWTSGTRVSGRPVLLSRTPSTGR
jgi:hypothetical protein